MKTNLKITLLGLAVMLSCMTSCKKTPKEETGTDRSYIDVFPMFGNETLYLDSVYITDEGFQVKFTDIKFLVTDWQNGGKLLTDAAMFDYRETGNSFIQAKQPATHFSAIQGFLGVTSNRNHADPVAFPNDNVLNIMKSGDMHWAWNPGYIFVKVEAKVDTIPDNIPNFDHNVTFHIGKDTNLLSVDFPVVHWVQLSPKEYSTSMILDMHQFLSNSGQRITLNSEYTSHTAPDQEALSTKVIQNFRSALRFY